MEGSLNILRMSPNKGITHLFMGHPLSDGCDKTTVEPGNTFSPGVWTCGVSACGEANGKLYAPDLLEPDAVNWGFVNDDGFAPITCGSFNCGDALRIESFLTHLGGSGCYGTDFFEVRAYLNQPCSARALIVVRDVGPSGGKVSSMRWELPVLLVNGTIRFTFEQPPDQCRIIPEGDEFDSPMAVFEYNLGEVGERIIRLKVEHGFADRPCGDILPQHRPHAFFTVEQGFATAKTAWCEAAPAKIFAPDTKLTQIWERQIFHILSAMECGLPRIGAVNYPSFWMRDGVIILRALDLIGRHDLARVGNDYLAPLMFSGGFGAESDAPGEGIWCMVSHAKITGDLDWLEQIFPFIERRVAILEQMLAAKTPLYAIGENKMPMYQFSPAANLLCLPAENGCIRGRMDWHSPDFYINCWAIGGFSNACQAAALLGKNKKLALWDATLETLKKSVATQLLPQYGNDRDPVVTPYPSGGLADHPQLAEQFQRWYLTNRIDRDGRRIPEPLWSYFEVAQAHNAILLGQRELAWINLEGILDHPKNKIPETYQDISAFAEGEPGGNEYFNFRNDCGRRGWLDQNHAIGGNTPHNWTAAELVNLIRDIFVTEGKDGLILGSGIPDRWLRTGSVFGVQDMPTERGLISYTATVRQDGRLSLSYTGPRPYQVDIGMEIIEE